MCDDIKCTDIIRKNVDALIQMVYIYEYIYFVSSIKPLGNVWNTENLCQ